MIEVLIGAVLLGLGFWLGRKRVPAPVEQPRAEEQEQLLEDRAAFSQLMGYNAQRAYGLEE